MSKRSNFYFFTSLIFAIWFLLTSWVWVYFANLFISLPFGIASFFLWYKGRQIDSQKNRYKITIGILITGIITSLITLIMLK